jgi:ferredoxin-NADP reductase
MKHIVKIFSIEQITPNVKRFRFEKPEGYKFIPGQATYVSINTPKWKSETRKFTFTCLNEEKFLEFTIKEYKHGGVTEQLHKLRVGDELIIEEPFGTINYKGKGVFIAGGAGITPFIAIFRQLKKENQLEGNTLIFSNRTKKDIILEQELRKAFGKSLILTLTEEQVKGYENKRIDKDFLKEYIKDFSQNFYICGPLKFIEDINFALKELGANTEALIFEAKS